MKPQPRIERVGPMLGRLLEDFVFESATLGRITVPEGFTTDYASVPRAFWAIYPPDGEYTPAAVVHDYLYTAKEHEGKPIARAIADKIFREAMLAYGVPSFRARILFSAVRLGGWLAWKAVNAARRSEKMPDKKRPKFHKKR